MKEEKNSIKVSGFTSEDQDSDEITYGVSIIIEKADEGHFSRVVHDFDIKTARAFVKAIDFVIEKMEAREAEEADA